MDIPIILQAIWYTLCIIIATVTITKLVAKSVIHASTSVVQSNAQILRDAIGFESKFRELDQRLIAQEKNDNEINHRLEHIEISVNGLVKRVDKLIDHFINQRAEKQQ
jgi:hypothetical protein